MLLLTSALFPYSLSGEGMVNIGLGDVDLLILGLALMVIPNYPYGQRIRIPLILIAVAAYFGVCFFSSSFAGIGTYTIVCVVQMMVYLVFALIIIWLTSVVLEACSNATDVGVAAQIFLTFSWRR